VAIVDILKVGLSGFVFLLVYLAYRLVADEQKRRTASPQRMRLLSRYLWATIALAGLVAVVSLADLFTSRYGSLANQQECADSFYRLGTYSRLPSVTLEGFRASVDRHLSSCESLFDKIRAQ
jgi:hypothetical protein